MTAWTGKPCARCGGKKGPKHADLKYCNRCKYAVRLESKTKAHRTSVARTYGLSDGDYDRL